MSRCQTTHRQSDYVNCFCHVVECFCTIWIDELSQKQQQKRNHKMNNLLLFSAWHTLKSSIVHKLRYAMLPWNANKFKCFEVSQYRKLLFLDYRVSSRKNNLLMWCYLVWSQIIFTLESMFNEKKLFANRIFNKLSDERWQKLQTFNWCWVGKKS